ncbi:hypothetical protein GY325_004433 [Salmonella enterica]|nr:hypothetical protein [Salmonella enterica]
MPLPSAFAHYPGSINNKTAVLTSSPTFALRDSGGGFPLVDDDRRSGNPTILPRRGVCL